MKTIPLTKGAVAVVDDADYAGLVRFKWRLSRNTYAVCEMPRGDGSRVVVRMHRVILQAPAGMEVDHINGDGLDNRRSNLRLATAHQNRCNAKLSRASTSGLKGVYYSRRAKKWVAQIQVHGKQRYLGSFASKEEAARFRDVAARELHGVFARTNY